MKRWIVKYFPGECSGSEGNPMRRTLLILCIVSLLVLFVDSSKFLIRYENSAPGEYIYDSDYYYWEGKRVEVDILRKIPGINSMMEGVFVLWPLLVVFGVAIAVMNYRSYFYPNKSIYVMKRLRSRWELHLRCLVFPVVWIIFVTGVCIALGCIYHHMYFHNTIPERIPETTLDIWRTLSW